MTENYDPTNDVEYDSPEAISDGEVDDEFEVTTHDEADNEMIAEENIEEEIEEVLDKNERTFTDEEIDEVADTAIAVLQDILKYFELGEVTIDEYEGDEGELILDITGDNLAVLIGRHGRTLESLQFLITSILYRKLGFRYPVFIDVQGYKSRQRQKIEDIAYSAEQRAVEQDRRIKLRPMTPYERRIVHLYLRNDDRVETKSEGEGHARRVVIIPR